MNYFRRLVFSAYRTVYRNVMFTVLLTGLCTALICSFPKNAAAISLIRDSEIERFLQEWSHDVIKATGLEPGSVNIVLVNSDEINAFVAGGPNVFIYTGLLQRSESPEEVIGVIAHELGHIAGGHLIRSRAAMESASYETIIGTILGVGAAILSGDGGAMAAVSGAAQNYATSKYLVHSRVQESSADQAALGYLEAAKIDPSSLVSFLETLQSNELLPATQQSEYYRTHPITRNRISALTSRIEAKHDGPYKANTNWQEQHRRMKAKLLGFIAPARVAWEYDSDAKDVSSVMAYAVSAYQLSDEDTAVKKVRQLVSLEKDNPYYYELEGQIYADFGRLKESRQAYDQAHKLMPNDGLIAMAYAHILIAGADTQNKDSADMKDLHTAIGLLKGAIRSEPRSPRLYRLLATAYGRLEDDARATLYLAEEAYLKRNVVDTGQLAEKAIRGLDEESQEWRRAKDLIFYAQQAKKAKKDDR
jgi:predicted Zn-dependent protease